MQQAELNLLAKKTLDAAFRVHSTLGPVFWKVPTLPVSFSSWFALLLKCGPKCLCRSFTKKLADVEYKIDILVANELVSK